VTRPDLDALAADVDLREAVTALADDWAEHAFDSVWFTAATRLRVVLADGGGAE